MTYEYLCTACGHAWEAEQSISAAALTTCPHCHTENAKRQVSGGAGFILKGGGWYSDLYSSSNAPKKSGDDAKSGDTKSAETTTKSADSGSKSADATTKSPDKGSSGSSGSSGSGSTGSTPTSGTSGGSKAAGAPSGA
ncbi:MAG TPA: zinc ribbon domain-containing protein [Polyangiaceae bacterium]|jgi:putative FmdB family regulatory protein|nr:zinc ribbon domain-containing protein [Polyangiaceae bacterium]